MILFTPNLLKFIIRGKSVVEIRFSLTYFDQKNFVGWPVEKSHCRWKEIDSSYPYANMKTIEMSM